MSSSFHPSLVNGPFEDPCLHVRFLRERRAALFDAGNMGRLGAADILKISDIFISHTHIDHFIGFDTILRTSLRREETLRVYGPENIIDCVQGKLHAYTWNLIQMYPLAIEVHAVSPSGIRRMRFDARDSFRPMDMGSVPYTDTLLEGDGFRVRTVMLDHGTPCMGYTLEEDFHINIDKAALTDMGLPVGPWLAGLKRAIRAQMEDGFELLIDGSPRTLGSLRQIATITRGQKITYLTDISPTPDNVLRARDFAMGSDALYCEAYFLHADIERARERNHLTGRLSGWIARTARAHRFIPLHGSPKYRSEPRNPHDEAVEEFGRDLQDDGMPLP